MSPLIGIVVGLLSGALLLSLGELLIFGPHRRRSREEARRRAVEELARRYTKQKSPRIVDEHGDYGPN